MTTMLGNYLLFLIAFQPLEEYYNCLHPNLVSELPHFVCTWDEGDFEKVGKRNVLKKKCDTDNKYKAWGRQQYWNRIDKEKINGKSNRYGKRHRYTKERTK